MLDGRCKVLSDEIEQLRIEALSEKGSRRASDAGLLEEEDEMVQMGRIEMGIPQSGAWRQGARMGPDPDPVFTLNFDLDCEEALQGLTGVDLDRLDFDSVAPESDDLEHVLSSWRIEQVLSPGV